MLTEARLRWSPISEEEPPVWNKRQRVAWEDGEAAKADPECEVEVVACGPDARAWSRLALLPSAGRLAWMR